MLKGRTEYILTGIFGFVFLLCAFMIIRDIVNYQTAKKEYAGLNEALRPDRDISLPEDTEGNENTLREPEDTGYFDRLYDINNDLVCILSIPSIGLNYPVVQGTDNEKYLNYTFEGKKNPAGCLFLDYKNDSSFSDGNIYIYGHNMKDGSMFGSLKQMTKEGFDKTGVKAYITTRESTFCYNLDDVEVVDIESYKASDDRKKDLLTLYTCWGKDRSRRLLVTFSKDKNRNA